jgi:hypothetical protein
MVCDLEVTGQKAESGRREAESRRQKAPASHLGSLYERFGENKGKASDCFGIAASDRVSGDGGDPSAI